MNKSKQPMPTRLRKKMKKELRAAANQPDTVLKTDRNTPKELLSRARPNAVKKEQAVLKAFEKSVSIKKAKQKAPHSKRTNTGMIDVKSPPQIVHIEGKRWIKTLGKQTQPMDRLFTGRHIDRFVPNEADLTFGRKQERKDRQRQQRSDWYEAYFLYRWRFGHSSIHSFPACNKRPRSTS